MFISFHVALFGTHRGDTIVVSVIPTGFYFDIRLWLFRHTALTPVAPECRGVWDTALTALTHGSQAADTRVLRRSDSGATPLGLGSCVRARCMVECNQLPVRYISMSAVMSPTVTCPSPSTS